MGKFETSIEAEVERVGHISIIPSILEVVCHTTGMGFAAVARVTPEKWIACQVRDEIKFGLLTGGELKVDTTICHEIRQSGEGVIIDHVANDVIYVNHHTPATYGFQSYISIPIARENGDFFGTLCAIDPNPSLLNTPEIIGMFKAYAALISFHLNAIEQLSVEEVELLEAGTQEVLTQELNFLSHQELKGNADAAADDTQTPQQKLINKRSKQFASIIQQSTNRIKAYTIELKRTAEIVK